MTDKQWQTLLAVIDGEVAVASRGIYHRQFVAARMGRHHYTAVLFLGKTLVRSQHEGHRGFPGGDVSSRFLVGIRMCTEPSAFGAKTIWTRHAFPHADRVIGDLGGNWPTLREPNPKPTACSFVIQRLLNYQPEIERAGHEIRFAIARGPFNIASFLMGTTELMMGMMMDPDRVASAAGENHPVHHRLALSAEGDLPIYRWHPRARRYRGFCG